MSPQEKHMVKMIRQRIKKNAHRIDFVVKKLLEPMAGCERRKYEGALKDLYTAQAKWVDIESKMCGGVSYGL